MDMAGMDDSKKADNLQPIHRWIWTRLNPLCMTSLLLEVGMPNVCGEKQLNNETVTPVCTAGVQKISQLIMWFLNVREDQLIHVIAEQRVFPAIKLREAFPFLNFSTVGLLDRFTYFL